MARKRFPSPRSRSGRRIGVGIALVAGVFLIIGVVAFQFLPSMIEDVPAGENEDLPAEAADNSGVTRDGYIEADVGYPQTLNPLLAESSGEGAVAALLYRGLAQIDTEGDPQPDLARDWSVSDDGRTYTVELDPDATWHDGEPFTVRDVLFTITLVQEADFPGDQSLARFWRAVTVRQSGEQSIDFELLEPYSGFPNYLTLPILPKHEFGGILPGDLKQHDLAWGEVGTGPYTLADADEESGEVRLKARASGPEAPDIENVTFRFYESRDAALEAFQSGDVDGLSYVPLDELDDGSLPGNSRVYGSSMSGYTALYFNQRHPQFRDVETRRAIEYAVNRQAIVDSVMNGQAVPGTSPVPEMLSAHDPGKHAGYDPERASELLEAAGWQPGDDDVLHRHGERFIISLVVNGDDEQRMGVASRIEQQLWDVGIAVDIQAQSSADVQQALESRQFGAALYGWHTENGDPDCYQIWHSSQAEEGMNFTGFSDTNADEHLLSARRSVSVEERNQHYAEFQKVFAEQVPAVVVFYPRYHFAVSARIDGAEPRPLVNPSDHVRQIPEWSFTELSSAAASGG